MKIYNVTDPEFVPYGKIIEGYDVSPFVEALKTHTPLPEGTDYVAEESALQSLPESVILANSIFGGIPAQFGWCNGHNTKLNCLEYHRSSEAILGSEDFVLLLAKEEEVIDGVLDTSKIKAFRVSAGVLVEQYATTLHYAPCCIDPEKGFKVMIVLPRGTNAAKPDMSKARAPEDKLLWACNKWLIAHKDTNEAKAGAWVGLAGINIDISEE